MQSNRSFSFFWKWNGSMNMGSSIYRLKMYLSFRRRQEKMGTWKCRNELDLPCDLHRLGDIAVWSPHRSKRYIYNSLVSIKIKVINPPIQQRLHTRRHLHLKNQVAHMGRIDGSVAMDDSAQDSKRQITSISIFQSRRSERMERIQNEPLKLYSTLLASKRHCRE